MGAGSREIHPSTPGEKELDRADGNYQISHRDRLESLTPREKFDHNIAAIQILQKLREERRQAYAGEMQLLVLYSGWGGLPQAFSTPEETPAWAEQQATLKALLSPGEYDAARASVLNAHYTPPVVIRRMYDAVRRLGFTHGRILEAALGTGHFFGNLPRSIATQSELTGIEIDPISSEIARHLYPRADIRNEPFETATLPTNRYDLVISNVPFGDYAPHDPKLNARKFKIHDYYFVAAADKARPGGLIAFITSRGTLDKQYPHLREAVAKSCDLVAAFRLPHRTFKAIANTEVTTDLVILRKRLPGEKAAGAQWLHSRLLPTEAQREDATALGSALGVALHKPAALDLLAERSEAKAGPMDGGCLIVAKALQHYLGGGELVRLASEFNGGQTEHYGLATEVGIFDATGFHPSSWAWLEEFNRREKFTGKLKFEHGYDESSDIPDDPRAVKELAGLLRKTIRHVPGGSADPKEAIFLNEYYHEHSHHLLGRLERVEHGLYARPEVRLTADGRDVGKELQELIESLPANLYRPLTPEEAAQIKQVIPAPPGTKPNAYVLTADGGGGIAIRDGDELRLLNDLPLQTRRRLRGMISVRDSVRECLRLQVEDMPDDVVEAGRAALNRDYDNFVGQFGPLSSSANTRAFAGDPDLPLLLSLENYDEDNGVATKTAIFRERTIQRRSPILAASGAKEALVISLNEKGRVDLEHIGSLLGRKSEEFLPELQGALFLDPTSKRWETDDAYLSGNVRAKLAIARTAAKDDARFAPNVAALEAVQPTDLTASEIDARLGAAWLHQSDIEDFGRELLRGRNRSDVRVGHAPTLGLWTVEVGYAVKSLVTNTDEWGTSRRSAHELLEDALNLRTPTIYDYDDEGKPHLNPSATEAARDKQQKIKDRFLEWLWTDDGRRARLVAYYNEHFNHTRLRAFNGDHLTLPGASPAVTLRSHQKAGVWRILQTPNALLAHVVGAGKTYTMVAAGMELKRLGLARKPMFVVPNHMLGQFSSELLTLYPNANILAAGRDDFTAARRRELMARIATSNWDAIIVTHSGFERLPVRESAREEFFKAQIRELEAVIYEHRERTGGAASGTRIVKELERAKKKLEGKLKTLAASHKKDDTVTFEELGIDRLFVDEAQAFKNLFYITKMTRVAGLPQAASERAFDMLLKVQHVQSRNDGGGVVFATGTPITNTMAEMFTMQRYLEPEILKKHSLQHFDAWAGTFGETVTAMELAPDGAGYRMHTRFARFVNVPELMTLFRQMADIQTATMLKLPIPELETGKPRIVSAPATSELKAFVASLAKRAEKLKQQKVDPSVDNMLKITGEGRKAALDLRLVRPNAHDYPDSKVNLAVREIHAIWKETARDSLTQMVFCDLSTPQAEGFSVYRDLKEKLVSRGVPAEEIAFIHDYDSDAAKLALFKDVRAGKVRVLAGSTQKMGAGTNAQTKLVALHHLDGPWRPADIEQREGRILRQGNENKSVRVFRYVTEGSFDAYIWQTLETKAKFISQVMTGESTARRIEDLDAPALTYAEVKAIASGNPLVIEKAKIDSEVMRLARLRSGFQESQFGSRRRLRCYEEDVLRIQRHLKALESDLLRRIDTQGDKFRCEIDGKTYTERAAAGNALVYLVADHRDNHRAGRAESVKLGSLGGFAIEYRSTLPSVVTLRGATEYQANVSVSPLGFISSLEHAIRCIDDNVIKARESLASTRSQISELEALQGKVWEHEERYRELTKRQAELVDLLDLAKNQASAQQTADAVTPEQAPQKTVKAGARTARSAKEERGAREKIIPIAKPPLRMSA